MTYLGAIAAPGKVFIVSDGQEVAELGPDGTACTANPLPGYVNRKIFKRGKLLLGTAGDAIRSRRLAKKIPSDACVEDVVSRYFESIQGFRRRRQEIFNELTNGYEGTDFFKNAAPDLQYNVGILVAGLDGTAIYLSSVDPDIDKYIELWNELGEKKAALEEIGKRTVSTCLDSAGLPYKSALGGHALRHKGDLKETAWPPPAGAVSLGDFSGCVAYLGAVCEEISGLCGAIGPPTHFAVLSSETGFLTGAYEALAAREREAF
ncbi:MAG: hypothetical protein V1820_06270 [archaeon]